MDPIYILGIIAAIYICIYLVAKKVGTERLNERGIDAGTPFFIMLRTQRLNAFLTRLGKKVPRAFFNVGVIIAFGGMVFGFIVFTENLVRFFIQPQTAGGVVPIIPGVTITGLPLVYLIIALAFTMVAHEFGHGLASARDEIPIKSAGLLSFFVLFGAFVEPEEEVFENEASPKSRMRLLAAGSYSNLIWSFLVLILLTNFGALMSIAFNPPNGAYIYDISSESPAEGVLNVGDVIIGLNETEIETWAAVSEFMANTSAGAHLMISTLDGSYNITLAPSEANASRGYIGIFGADYWEPKQGWEWIPGGPLYVINMQQILIWMFIIQFSIALFNLLPIPALDGDKLLSNGLSLVIKNQRTVKRIMWPIRIFALAVVILSIGLSFWYGKGIF